MKKITTHSNKSAKHIETFLFCPKVGQTIKAIPPEHLFDNFDELQDKLNECVVFFNLPSALQYCRFMNNDHVVLRAFVEHTAVEGFENKLGIKKGALTKNHIHGCFPGWAKNSVYVENPDFSLTKSSVS